MIYPPRMPADYVSIKRDPTPEEMRMIRQYGKRYQAAALPDDIETGPMGWCFDWSMIQCIKTKEKYHYCEGVAKDPQDGKWKLHAWLTDGTHAYDATWGIESKLKGRIHLRTKYIGIEISLIDVMKFVRKTEYQGLIPNRFRDNGETLKRILEDIQR